MIFDGSTYTLPKNKKHVHYKAEVRIAFLTARDDSIVERLRIMRAEFEQINEYPSRNALAERLATQINLKAISILKITERLGVNDELEPSTKINTGFMPVYIAPTGIGRFHTCVWC